MQYVIQSFLFILLQVSDKNIFKYVLCDKKKKKNHLIDYDKYRYESFVFHTIQVIKKKGLIDGYDSNNEKKKQLIFSNIVIFSHVLILSSQNNVVKNKSLGTYRIRFLVYIVCFGRMSWRCH